MPPASKKCASVILFDLKAQPCAKQTLIKICCNNFFTKSKDLTKLILFNSDVTQNRLNSKHGGYNNINEVAPEISSYNPKLLVEMIEENSVTGTGNWLEGLYVALRNLEQEFEDIAGIITYQVLFITDLVTPLNKCDQSLIDKVVRGLKKIDAFLYVVGPNVEPPFTIKSQQHVKLWMRNLNVSPDNQNLMVLKKIISETDNSLVCDYKLGTHLFFSYRYWKGTQAWQVPLSIGTKIQIPANTFKVLSTEPKCKLKLKKTYSFRNPTWIDAEDETIEVDPGEVISGIIRHGKFVEMPSKKAFTVGNPRSFNVSCFTDSANVPEYIMRGNGCYRAVSKGTPACKQAFNMLVDCLAQQNKYIIARRIYNNNFAPKIVALVPKPDDNPKNFLFTSLPFTENMRVNYKEGKLQSAPKIETCDEVYNFLNSLNIENDACEKRIPLSVNMMQNANSQKIINKGADKIFDNELMLEEIDTCYLEAPRGDAFSVLSAMWPERALKEVSTKAEADGSDDDFDW